MIYSIVGTHKETREKAAKEFAILGEIAQSIYSEQIDELESHLDARSLFGEKVIISCVQLGGNAVSKEIFIDLLPKMEASPNIFVIDEPFADVHLSNKLSKVSVKFFNAKEEKVKDTSVFRLCDSFVARDKRAAWEDFMSLRDKGEGEAIAGALWWRFQQVWTGVRAGKKSPFSLSECERIGGDIVRASILAHRGEKDLMTELERIILSL